MLEKIRNLPEMDQRNVIELVQHNEWGIAFDTLCNQIHENDIAITEKIYEEIEEIGYAMNMKETNWLFLKELIE